MSTECSTFSGECIRASICEGYDDEDRIVQLIGESPTLKTSKEILTQEDLVELIAPVLQAWCSEGCFKAKIEALRNMQENDDISDASKTMSLGIVDSLQKSQLEF